MRHEGCGCTGHDKRDVCQHYAHNMFNTGGRTITRRAVGTEKHARKVKFTVVVILENRRINSSPACKTKIKQTLPYIYIYMWQLGQTLYIHIM